MLAFLNGSLREEGRRRLTSELTAHELSTAIGLGLFSLYPEALTHFRRIEPLGQASAIGAISLDLAALFEFVFGGYVVGYLWSGLLSDYNLLEGSPWTLVLIWTAAGPYVLYRLRS